MSSTKAKELKLDIDDLNNLLQLAQRQKSKDALSLELRRLQTELSKEMENNPSSEQTVTTKPVISSSKCYEVKINNHGWDQTDKFVKIYVPLQNVHALPPTSVTCDYTERSMHLRVLGLDNKNHDLLINNLCEDIIPENSSFKVKTDNIIISLAKQKPKQWSCMTEIEKKLKESKKTVPQIDKDEDPSSSLMNMMKKMYQEGDDDMKRMIVKAWTESQQKNKTMDML